MRSGIPIAKCSRTGWLRHDLIFLLLLPVIAVPLFGICLVNQDSYLDPWLYTGYGRMLGLLVDIGGWTYYSVRFPVIGMISLFSSVFSEPLGYILLRYFVYGIVAIPLYNLVAKSFSRSVALVAVVTLVTTPLLARIILWDLPPFIATPAALAGICLWLTPTSHRSMHAIAAGFMFATAINSHVFVATGIAAFLGVQFIIDCCAARSMRFVADLAWASLGGGICMAIGVIYYSLAVHPVGLRTFVEPTVANIMSGLDYHQQHQESASTIFAREFPSYVPFVVTAINGLVLGRTVFSTGVAARIFWFSAAYCGFYLFFHFVAGRNILGYHFYAGFLFPVIILQIPIIIHELGQSSRAAVGLTVTISFIIFLVLIPVLNGWLSIVGNYFLFLQDNSISVGIIAALIVVATGFTVAAVRVESFKPAAAVALSLFLQIALFSHYAYARTFSAKRAPYEFAVYMAAVDLIQLLRQYDAAGHRVRIWYPRGDVSMFSISFVNLGSTLQPPYGVNETGMPSIGDYERKRLELSDSGYVLLLARTEETIDAGLAALRSTGSKFEQVIRTELGPCEDFRIKAVFVSLQH
jgi:hypothetical protein